MRREIVAVARYRRIDVDEPSDSALQPIRRPGHDHPPIGMPHKHDILELVRFDHPRDVFDVCLERWHGLSQMSPLADAGEGRRQDTASARLDDRSHAVPTPRAVPGAVNEDDGQPRI
jgi:hypothetical protein